jgi:anti-sigma factor RsiW
MHHEKKPETIHAYLKGLLPPGEQAAFEKHLQACAPCRSAVEDEKKLNALLSALDAPEPSPGFQTRLFARLAADPKPRAMGFLAPWAIGPIFSAAVVLLGLALWHEWPRLGFQTHPANHADLTLADQHEFLSKLEILQHWEMLQHWDEIAAAKPGKEKL